MQPMHANVPIEVSLPPALAPIELFQNRHIGPTEDDVTTMLKRVGCESLADLTSQTVPKSIASRSPLALMGPRSEHELLHHLRAIAQRNELFRSFIGCGYHDCITPPVIQRNILENPGWYTQYTPYQPEISQGRLEALLNFQTMVCELTALPLANASLLDEATAAAEALTMCRSAAKGKRNAFFVADHCHPQTIAVVQTRAHALGIQVVIGNPETASFEDTEFAGILLSYPTTDGRIQDFGPTVARAHAAGARVVVAADLLALTLLTPPGQWGADIAVGSTQRFGVPLGFGGPHAAFLSAKAEFARQLPGRLVGVTHDAAGQTAYRLALQTREQHIRRDRATSNICTAQVLLAIMAGMYAVYHGPRGLTQIARRIKLWTDSLAKGLGQLGHSVDPGPYFDTIRIRCDRSESTRIVSRAHKHRINLRVFDDHSLGISLSETTAEADIAALLSAFATSTTAIPLPAELAASIETDASLGALARTTPPLEHPVFERYHSEHEMLRYLHRLQAKDLSLTTSMIPLGSCTMKLNATSEMTPITWPEFASIHPFAPREQTRGYAELLDNLCDWLATMTGFDAVSLQPNSGAQGEFAGLLVIRAFHRAHGNENRNVCLIPTSAHGTNPASAVMAGFRVVAVACDADGSIDVEDLRTKATAHADTLGALMVTYPSTHGVFEESIRDVCDIIHAQGGQVYLDGANMNAQLGLCKPGDYGADVCHLNLHKTFCIPHGGGGPGIGPIAVAKHLTPYLPGHPAIESPSSAIGPIAAAPFGSAAILPISWMYIALMGAAGLTRASEIAILNANYMARRLETDYEVVFRGRNGYVAHEFVIDCRPFKKSAGVSVEDIAKRLMDFGFHAPTMSWPVAGTLMIEPTESESKQELDRFCDAMLAIRQEIRDIESGALTLQDSPLGNAPHTAQSIATAEWNRAYSRQQAAFPAPWLREHKYWPPVSRVDNTYGDRNLFCTCPPLELEDNA